MILCAVGAPRSGKTTTCLRYLKWLRDIGAHTRYFVISPTYFNAKHLHDWLGVEADDAYIDSSQVRQAFADILTKCRAEFAAYKENVAHHEAWIKYTKRLRLTPNEAFQLEQQGQPTTVIQNPRWGVVLDDLMGSPWLASAQFKQICIAHRHLIPGSNGLSLILMSQSLKSGSLTRPLRSCCGVWLIWSTKDRGVIKDVWEQVAGKVDFQTFERIFEHCTEGKFNYLVADLTQGNPKKTFRKTLEGEWLDPIAFQKGDL